MSAPFLINFSIALVLEAMAATMRGVRQRVSLSLIPMYTY